MLSMLMVLVLQAELHCILVLLMTSASMHSRIAAGWLSSQQHEQLTCCTVSGYHA
jgi:hypothetical protein